MGAPKTLVAREYYMAVGWCTSCDNLSFHRPPLPTYVEMKERPAACYWSCTICTPKGERQLVRPVAIFDSFPRTGGPYIWVNPQFSRSFRSPEGWLPILDPGWPGCTVDADGWVRDANGNAIGHIEHMSTEGGVVTLGSTVRNAVEGLKQWVPGTKFYEARVPGERIAMGISQPDISGKRTYRMHESYVDPVNAKSWAPGTGRSFSYPRGYEKEDHIAHALINRLAELEQQRDAALNRAGNEFPSRTRFHQALEAAYNLEIENIQLAVNTLIGYSR